MKMRGLFLTLLGCCIFCNVSGQGLKPPKSTCNFKTDSSIVIKKAVPAKPLFSSVKYDYYNHLGAACKLEFKFEKATKVPLRLRLGSLQQTDYLEQKPNAIKPENNSK